VIIAQSSNSNLETVAIVTMAKIAIGLIALKVVAFHFKLKAVMLHLHLIKELMVNELTSFWLHYKVLIATVS
jgi:hypothetical protein